MATTIQISKELLESLKQKKMYDNESYENIIWDMMEDTMELSAQTKQRIEQAKIEIARGKTKTHEQVKSELGF